MLELETYKEITSIPAPTLEDVLTAAGVAYGTLANEIGCDPSAVPSMDNICFDMADELQYELNKLEKGYAAAITMGLLRNHGWHHCVALVEPLTEKVVLADGAYRQFLKPEKQAESPEMIIGTFDEAKTQALQYGLSVEDSQFWGGQLSRMF